jgi:citrate lyase beta subunit
MKTSLTDDAAREIGARLRAANEETARLYPGESARRQPVHTVYGGAHLFKADTAARLGSLALRSLEQFAPDAATLARAAGMFDAGGAGDTSSRPSSAPLAETVYERVAEKLRREPVEDFRIDFEDGYGNRPDAEEDSHAEAAATEVARGLAGGTLPPFIGIRIKPFTEELRARSFRTLDIFLSTLVERAGGALPPNFVVTLPKITAPEQVAALADFYDAVEPQLGLGAGSLRFELMIETTQSIIDALGRVSLPLLLRAARGRCVAAHFGTYDYTAACQITAAHQHMLHPACDFAKHMMQVAFSGTGVWLSDGATNIMPVAPHRAAEGQRLSPEQAEENLRSVHRAWRVHFGHVRHSLTNGFYQGWDLHPAQLPTRYAAVYSFFLESLDAASERLRNFVEKAAKATLVGDVFDDAATGQGLLNYFLRATNCGAINEDEATRLSGLTPDELRSGSFVKILKGRTEAGGAG